MLQNRSSFDRNPFGWILSALVTLLVIYVVAQVAFWLLKLLWWVPLLMVAASLVIDRSVAFGFVRSIKNLFQRRLVYGLIASVLAIVAYPLVGMYLLGLALFRKKIKEKALEADEWRNGRWTEHKDVTDEPLDLDVPYEELPPAPEPQPRQPRRGSEYDDLFN